MHPRINFVQPTSVTRYTDDAVKIHSRYLGDTLFERSVLQALSSFASTFVLDVVLFRTCSVHDTVRHGRGPDACSSGEDRLSVTSYTANKDRNERELKE